MRLRNIAAVVVLAAVVGNAQAELFDRGGGLIYDDVLNVTWLQDANYAKTSGYDADGKMNWAAANTWTANLSFHDSVRNVDYTDWRLPTTAPIGANWNYTSSYNGSTDVGPNITSPNSELSYMYYVNLGLKGNFSPSGTYQSDFGVFGNGTVGGQKNVGLVDNLQSDRYWSGTIAAIDPAMSVWSFYAPYGIQAYALNFDSVYAWAVRDGDVASVAAPIPEPETYAMLITGLGLLGLTARRRRRKLNA